MFPGLIVGGTICNAHRMKSVRWLLLLALMALAVSGCSTAGLVASKPLYRDPVFDGAADPVVIWNPQVKRWWMFYTNRRANMAGASGVTWVHGTPIGIAESADGGAHWKYFGNAQFDLPRPIRRANHIRCPAGDVRAAVFSGQIKLRATKIFPVRAAVR